VSGVEEMTRVVRDQIGPFRLACGGISVAELSEAGALAVYRDPQDILEHLAESPIGALLT